MRSTVLGQTLRRRLSRLAPGRVIANVRDLVFALPVYPYTLMGPTPRGLAVVPPDPWPGVAARGSAILQGEFDFGDERVTGDAALWESPHGRHWDEQFHGFGWIADLHMVGNDAARQRARKLVSDWIDHNARWSRTAWRGDVLGRRVVAWLGQYDFFCASGDDSFRARVMASLTGQVRHLSRSLPGDLDGAPLLTATKGLVYAGACLPGRESWLSIALKILDHELPRQIRGDGGHFERSPSAQLSVLRDLVDVRTTLTAARRPVPDALQAAIDRMAPALRFFRHGDGALALFNDSREEEPWLIDTVLTRADARGKPLASMPHIGFQRLQSGRTLVIADTGVPAAISRAFDIEDRAHAGTLSFEMSAGKERMIVNCGAHHGGSLAWRRAQRMTAAHSTLTLADTSSAAFDDEGKLEFGPKTVTCRREEGDGNVLIEASHDGYVPRLGAFHKRRLFLAAGGEDFRGEDSLVPVVHGKIVPRDRPDGEDSKTAGREEERGLPFAVRFHLHPAVQASLIQNGAAVLLRLPSGAGWRLRASGARLSLEESVYLGAAGDEMRRSEQIVLSGWAAPGKTARVKWAFTRVSEKG
ncbi:MAG: heparinase II/III family protein [Alphaproteobacteria bacterium]